MPAAARRGRGRACRRGTIATSPRPPRRRLERRKIELGQVNPLAKEEYECEKERLLSWSRRGKTWSEACRSSRPARRARRDRRAVLRRHLPRRRRALRGGSRPRSSPAARAGSGSSSPRRRAASGVEVELHPAGEDHAARDALRRREGLEAISFLFALFLAKPCPFYLLDEVEARARRREHRPLRPAPAPLRRPRAVRGHHPPEADDGGRRRALRRDDGRRRDQPDRLPPPPARGSGSAGKLEPGCAQARPRSGTRKLKRVRIAARIWDFALLSVELVLRGQALRRLDQPGVDQPLPYLVLVDVLEPDEEEGGDASKCGVSR